VIGVTPKATSIKGVGDFWTFFWAIASHWITVMSGVVAVSVGIIQFLRQKKFAPSTWIVVGMGCLLFASYQAWLDEHVARNIAEGANRSFQSQLDERQKHAAIRAVLGRFMLEGSHLLTLCTDETKPVPKAEQIEWVGRIEEFVRKNLDESYLGRLLAPPSPPYTAHFASQDRNETCFNIYDITTNLQIIAKDFSP
jgi:hypothetical protein